MRNTLYSYLYSYFYSYFYFRFCWTTVSMRNSGRPMLRTDHRISPQWAHRVELGSTNSILLRGIIMLGSAPTEDYVILYSDRVLASRATLRIIVRCKMLWQSNNPSSSWRNLRTWVECVEWALYNIEKEDEKEDEKDYWWKYFFLSMICLIFYDRNS